MLLASCLSSWVPFVTSQTAALETRARRLSHFSHFWGFNPVRWLAGVARYCQKLCSRRHFCPTRFCCRCTTTVAPCASASPWWLRAPHTSLIPMNWLGRTANTDTMKPTCKREECTGTYLWQRLDAWIAAMRVQAGHENQVDSCVRLTTIRMCLPDCPGQIGQRLLFLFGDGSNINSIKSLSKHIYAYIKVNLASDFVLCLKSVTLLKQLLVSPDPWELRHFVQTWNYAIWQTRGTCVLKLKHTLCTPPPPALP